MLWLDTLASMMVLYMVLDMGKVGDCPCFLGVDGTGTGSRRPEEE